MNFNEDKQHNAHRKEKANFKYVVHRAGNYYYAEKVLTIAINRHLWK